MLIKRFIISVIAIIRLIVEPLLPSLPRNIIIPSLVRIYRPYSVIISTSSLSGHVLTLILIADSLARTTKLATALVSFSSSYSSPSTVGAWMLAPTCTAQVSVSLRLTGYSGITRKIEIFPTRIRARGVGFSVAGLFTMTLIYTEVAPTAFAEVGWRFYLLFIILPLVGVGFMWTFFPETKGRPLEEIAGLFGDEVAVDISHLDEGQRRALDKSLMVDGTPENEKIGHGEKAVHAEERETNMA